MFLKRPKDDLINSSKKYSEPTLYHKESLKNEIYLNISLTENICNIFYI